MALPTESADPLFIKWKENIATQKAAGAARRARAPRRQRYGVVTSDSADLGKTADLYKRFLRMGSVEEMFGLVPDVGVVTVGRPPGGMRPDYDATYALWGISSGMGVIGLAVDATNALCVEGANATLFDVSGFGMTCMYNSVALTLNATRYFRYTLTGNDVRGVLQEYVASIPDGGDRTSIEWRWIGQTLASVFQANPDQAPENNDDSRFDYVKQRLVARGVPIPEGLDNYPKLAKAMVDYTLDPTKNQQGEAIALYGLFLHKPDVMKHFSFALFILREDGKLLHGRYYDDRLGQPDMQFIQSAETPHPTAQYVVSLVHLGLQAHFKVLGIEKNGKRMLYYNKEDQSTYAYMETVEKVRTEPDRDCGEYL